MAFDNVVNWSKNTHIHPKFVELVHKAPMSKSELITAKCQIAKRDEFSCDLMDTTFENWEN